MSFNYVEVWPPAGRTDRPWCDDPDEDAFVKSARSVTELYSRALGRLRIAGRCSMLRIVCRLEPASEEVLVEVHTDPPVSFESAFVHLPPGIGALAPVERAELVLDVVHGAVLRLARTRGWDDGLLATIPREVRAAGLTFRWDGPWKASPDRRLRARAQYRLLEDGYGRALIALQERGTEELVAVSGEALASSTSTGFERSAHTLSWDGSSVVQLLPYSGTTRDAVHGLVRLQRVADQWHSYCSDGMNQGRLLERVGREKPVRHRRPLRITVRGSGVDAPDSAPRIRIVGGGPMNGVPHAYDATLTELLRVFAGEEGQWWWLAAGIKELLVRYDFAAREPSVRLRRRGHELTAQIDRPVGTLLDCDPRTRAHADVEALVATVRRRTGLGPHPELSG